VESAQGQSVWLDGPCRCRLDFFPDIPDIARFSRGPSKPHRVTVSCFLRIDARDAARSLLGVAIWCADQKHDTGHVRVSCIRSTVFPRLGPLCSFAWNRQAESCCWRSLDRRKYLVPRFRSLVGASSTSSPLITAKSLQPYPSLPSHLLSPVSSPTSWALVYPLES
jgi:hypothetical protein